MRMVSLVAAASVMTLAAPTAAQDLEASRKACSNEGSYSPSQRVAGCTALIQAAPSPSPAILNNRAGAYSEQRDYTAAIADYSEAIRLYPQFELAFYGRAEAYRQSKDYAHATEDYDSAIVLDPKDAYSLFGRGLAKKASGRTAEGEADIASATAIDPNIAAAFGY
jgi:tetratricopeptide (TPR) repeat protein